MMRTHILSGKRMLCGLALAMLVGAGASAVVAQEDPIAARKALFKQMAGALKAPGQMLKGEAPLDLAKVKEGLAVVAANSAKLGSLFPESSKTGDTGALPKIWEDKADFTGRFDTLGKDAAAAIVSIKDMDSFRAAMPKVLGNCGACHKIYRKPT
ncbi:c-type cytochrome [Camelimonas sp. ID_303_24]